MYRLILLAIVLPALFLSACFDQVGGEGQPCNQEGLCQPGLVCSKDNKCIKIGSVECVADADCPLCQWCYGSTCEYQPAGDDLKDDCQPGECLSGACDGAGACGFEPDGTDCGDPADTECTLPDKCDGNGRCLTNHMPSGTPCGDQGVACHKDDACDGAGTCFDRGFEPDGTPCPDNLFCNGAETCDDAGTCQAGPGDPCSPPTVCNESQDTCTGCNSHTDCPVCMKCNLGTNNCENQLEGEDMKNECNPTECLTGSCGGSGICGFEPEGKTCGDNTDNDCDNPDSCDGSGSCAYNYKIPGTPCGNQADTDCDNPDSCDGFGNCSVNHEPLGTLCGDQTDTECDNPDACDTSGNCISNYESSGLLCLDGLFCNGEETCDGSGNCQEGPGDPCAPNMTCDENIDACLGCGNGIREDEELCDDLDLGGLTCNGGLSCTNDCLLDASDCTLPGLGDGSDGVLVVDNIVNINQVGAPEYAVDSIGIDWVDLVVSGSGLTTDDEVILINLQGSELDCSPIGTYEFLDVSSVNGIRVYFQSQIQGGYGVGGSNADLTGQRIVLMRVPHFSSVNILNGGTLTANVWNGSTGGLIVMKVSDELLIEAGGYLSVDGLGYCGGIGYSNTNMANGRQGESICGNPQEANTDPNRGGGGGGRYMDTADDCGQGGGGGGYGTGGTWMPFTNNCINNGSNNPAQNGGQTYGLADISKLLMGSGGGAGASDDHSSSSGTGGAGGGIILISARRITLNGILRSQGADGMKPPDLSDPGNGGGGSGGTVYLRVGWMDGTGGISAQGGPGGPSTSTWDSAGGDGGNGRIRIDYHHAGGYVFESSDALNFLNNFAEPDPGYTEFYFR